MLRTSSTNRVMRSRMGPSMSRARKRRIKAASSFELRATSLRFSLAARSSTLVAPSHQFPSHHIECHGRGEAADALAIAGEVSFHDFGSGVAGNGVKYQANRFFGRTSTRASYAGDSDSQR